MVGKNFNIEIITPTIMGGSNSRELDNYKIRASEIKAVMRQVFRIFSCKYIDYKDHSKGIKKLLEKEGEIFGSTSQKSSFKLLLEDTKNLQTGKVDLLPHKTNGFKKDAVLPGGKFKLKLILLKNTYNLGIDFYQALLKTALLMGVGNRRNRLMGNMRILEDLNSDELDFNFLLESCGKISESEKTIYEDEPLFPCALKLNGDKKYYMVSKRKIKQTYLNNNVLNHSLLLKDLYINVIHKLEENEEYRHIIGSINPRRGSYINFSVAKDNNNNYYMYLFSFYYKNNDFSYEKWLKASELAKKLTEETFYKKENLRE